MKRQLKTNKPTAYYSRMIKNSYIDEYRKNERQRERCTPLGDDIENLAGTRVQVYVCKSCEDWLNHIENPVLEKELRVLSTENLHILYRSFVIGYTHEEIAQQLGFSRTTIGKRINQIVSDLRTICKQS